MILGILQARCSSSRLPNKVMLPILGRPMLELEIERIKRSKKIDELILATSTDTKDDALEKLAKVNNIKCYRGSLDDVLDRFMGAIKLWPTATHIVRLTGDCPLIDSAIIDQVIDLHLANDNDYTSNTLEPTYPDGLDVEVFKRECIEQAANEATLKSQREHVTLFIHQQPKKYKLGCLKNDTDLSALRWTVDEPEDFRLVTRIFDGLYGTKSNFSKADIVEFFKLNPALEQFNSHHKRNAGLALSLQDDFSLSRTGEPKTLIFRKVTIRDLDLLLEWRNDLATQLASISSAPVSRSEHQQWLQTSLTSHNRQLYIVEEIRPLANHVPIGTIRLDKRENEWELSWTVAPQARGKGLGKLMVVQATRLIDEPLVAVIKKSNYPSARIAEFAGFKLIETRGDLTHWKKL